MGYSFFICELKKERHTDKRQLFKSESPREKGVFANGLYVFYTPLQSQHVQNGGDCRQ